MRTQAIFMSGIIVLLLFNMVYVVSEPDALWTLTVGAVTGFIASVLAVGVISGINILGSGLSGISVKILFGVATILNMLYQVEIAGFPLGMGLASNLTAIFTSGDSLLQFLSYLVATVFSIVMLITGVMFVQGGAD
jgi:hypothetical protein